MKIFLSSTYKDLIEIRKAAINYLEGITGNIKNATGKIVVMEFFDASENTCKEECLYNISDCNLIIGIYGEAYGSVDPETDLSMTEIEFDYAVQHNIPILAFVMRTNNRDSRENKFIEDKIYSSPQICAHFDNIHDFIDRLDGSLKKYFKSFDGYSIDSLWSQVEELRNNIFENISQGFAGSELQIEPYVLNQEDIALNDILSCTYEIKKSIRNLQHENEAIYSYAYDKVYYPENITTEDVSSLIENLNNNSKAILLNWEIINIGFYNMTTRITLAAMYLKLCRMQHRLLVEHWCEELREEVLETRTKYLEAIKHSQYTD